MSGAAVFWSAVAAVAAGGSALVAAVYTWLTFKMVRSQSAPNVVVYIRHDFSRPSVLCIVVENIGRGLATDLRFTASRAIPNKAFGLSEETALPATVMTSGPLINGIPALGPGDSRQITWGQYGGLRRALGEASIELKCDYKHGKRRMPQFVGQLEVNSFIGTDAIESDSLRVINQLTRIAEALSERRDIAK